MSVQILGFRLLVDPEIPRITTVSGFFLPRVAQRPACTGRIVSVGPKLARRLPDLRPGMRIAFRPYAGQDLTVDRKTYRMLEYPDLIGVYTQAAYESQKETEQEVVEVSESCG